ncbi:MAG TPA: DUF4337 domain-containing protein [Telluria sp.]|nr:DUF4337 domain-containing protein [Telluria sp.]
MEITDAVSTPEAPTDPLNMRVAITVALLATFMGLCKVKDDNINQAMQQAQANKVDHWSFYQARNVREEVARSTVAQLRLTALGRPPAEQEAYAGAVKEFLQIADDQKRKKEEVKTLAEQDQADYDAANFRDDQFDLSDALLAIAISLLAITALTRQRWLFFGALIPTALGVFFGIAGLAGLPFHPNALMALLS